MESLTPEEIFRNGVNYTRNPHIQAEIRNVATYDAATILNEIKAEIHCRAAFSLSCFLLVSLGAALGLVSRGGQFIIAFAVGALPGMAMLAMIFIGKNMIESARIASDAVGMAMIWGGIGLLLVGTTAVYGWLVRR